MEGWVILCLVTLVSSMSEEWPKNYELYEGYQVIEITPQSSRELKHLRQILNDHAEVDVWLEPSTVGAPAHIMLSEDQFDILTKALRTVGLQFKIHIDDVSRSIKEFIRHRTSKLNNKVFDLNDYNSFEDIEVWLENTLLPQCEANPGLTCQLLPSEFKTLENRTIWIFTMSAGAGKQTIFIDGLIHAREWIVGGTLFKIMDRLVNRYGSDSEATELLDAYDFLFVPVLNADGYAFSWTDNRLWRKNRRPFGACTGVDLNRNFLWTWSLQGASNDTCSETYCGPGPVSEQEAKAIDALQVSLGADNVGSYITYHSYGQMWMFPWGNTEDFTANTPCERTVDYDALFAVAEATAQAIMATNGAVWTYGTVCETIYARTGASDDHAKGVYGYPFAFNPELRGNTFILPPEQIEPSYQENWNGLLAHKRALYNVKQKKTNI